MGKNKGQRAYLKNMRAKQRQLQKRSRLFGGNIYAAGEFVFLYSLIFVFILVMWFISVSNMTVYSYDDCKIKVLTYIDSYVDQEGRPVISAEEEKQKDGEIVYDTDEYEVVGDNFPLSEFKEKVFKGHKVKICYIKNGEIKQALEVSADNQRFLSLDTINSKTQQTKNTINIVFAILAGCWAVYVAAASYVMTNAPRYPRLVRLFVKKSYILPPKNDSKSNIHFVKTNRKE